MRTALREQHCRATWCPCTRKASDVRSYHTIRNHGAKNTKPKNPRRRRRRCPYSPLPAAVGQLGATGGGRAPGSGRGAKRKGAVSPSHVDSPLYDDKMTQCRHRRNTATLWVDQTRSPVPVSVSVD